MGSSGPDLSHCIPEVPAESGFNQKAVIPFGVTVDHVRQAMNEFTNFLGFIDTQLCTKDMSRFEDMLMPANFSSMVGEFMTASIPKYCLGGHPKAATCGHLKSGHSE